MESRTNERAKAIGGSQRNMWDLILKQRITGLKSGAHGLQRKSGWYAPGRLLKRERANKTLRHQAALSE